MSFKESGLRLFDISLAICILYKIPLHLLAGLCKVGVSILVRANGSNDGPNSISVSDSGLDWLYDESSNSFSSTVPVRLGIKNMTDSVWGEKTETRKAYE